MVRIDLLPSHMLGRRLQYAALSAVHNNFINKINIHAGFVDFGSKNNYVSLVSTITNSIVDRLQLNNRQPTQITISVGGRTVDCGTLDSGPKLYRGKPSDADVLDRTIYRLATENNAPTCYYIDKNDRQRSAWTHAALTYATTVKMLGGPIGTTVNNVPRLVSATLFSKIRGAGRPRSGTMRISVDSLGLALLGGAIAFMGRETTAGGVTELYMLPDLASNSYWMLSDIVANSGGRSAASVALWISSSTGASLELVLSLEVAVNLASKYGVLQGLLPRSALELLSAARLYFVSPGQYRPMIRGAMVFSDVLAASYDVRLLRSLEGLARRSASWRGSGSSSVKRAVASCISNLYMQVLNPCNLEYSYDCSRSLMAIAESKRDRIPNVIKESAGIIAQLVVQEARKLALNAGCV